MAKVLGGFQPDTKSESARRADFDLRRRAGQGGGGSLPPGADPGEVLTIDGSGNPVWAAGTPGPAGPPGATGSQGPPGPPGEVPAARTISTTLPLTGGGDLSVNRTLAIDTFTPTVKGAVPPPGTVTGKVLSDAGTWVTGGSGGGTDEVWVGTTDPIGANPTIELWFDSDAVVADIDPVRQWNSAWGVVATYTNATDITGIVAETWVNSGMFTAVAGRRYSLMVRQVVSHTVASDSFYLRANIGGFQVLFYNTEPRTDTVVYHLPTVNYQATTGGAKQIYVSLYRSSGTGTATALNGSYVNAYIDVIDEGPISGAFPADPGGSRFGVEAGKPVAPTSPASYIATDTKREWLWDGTGWIIMGEPAQTWAPTFASGITVGAGVWSADYHRCDGFCDIRGRFTFGAGTAITGHVKVNLPFIAAAVALNWLSVAYFDTNLYWTGISGAESDAPGLYPSTASQAYTQITTILAATVPFTWASGHSMQFSGRYRMASRYS